MAGEITVHVRRSRPHYDRGLKEHAVRLVLDEGKSIALVARELAVAETTLRTWVKRARTAETVRIPRGLQKDETSPDAKDPASDAESQSLSIEAPVTILICQKCGGRSPKLAGLKEQNVHEHVLEQVEADEDEEDEFFDAQELQQEIETLKEALEDKDRELEELQNAFDEKEQVRAPHHRDHLFHAIVITHSTAS